MLHSSGSVVFDVCDSAFLGSVYAQEAFGGSMDTVVSHANMALAFHGSEAREVVAARPPPEPPPRLSQVRLCALSGSENADGGSRDTVVPHANVALAFDVSEASAFDVSEVSEVVAEKPPLEPPHGSRRFGSVLHWGLRRFT